MNSENTTLQLSLPSRRSWKTALRLLPIEGINPDASSQLQVHLIYPIATNPDEIIIRIEAMKAELEGLGCQVEIEFVLYQPDASLNLDAPLLDKPINGDR